MITTKLYGRVGNQMFQIANCIAHGLRHGMEYQIPNYTGNTKDWPVYFTHFPVLTVSMDDFGTFWEKSHGYTLIPRKEQVCFDGYWQSYKYFEDFKNIVINAFMPAFKKIAERVANTGFDFSDRVSIHVRRGDYLEYETKHPTVNHAYLTKAIDHFLELGLNNFSVFSDDIEWCQQNITNEQFPGAIIQHMAHKITDPVEDALYDLYTMSKHHHNIISNSTFSYWGAMLNKNPDKIVLTPSVENWFGPENKHLDVSDLLPPEWIQIQY